MTWAKVSDDSAFNPVALAPAEHPDFDDRLINEVFGFVMRCATQSGAHLTDYIISRGTALQVAGPSRLDAMLEVGIFAGYLTVVEVDGRTAYKIIDDPNFIHLRPREEVEWERVQRRDSADVSLRIPVRFRDGDACRYCARVVDWDSRTGGMGGTYDHLDPLNPETTVDTFVVACRTCNSARKRGDTSFPLALRNAPEEPYYSPTTRKMFQGNVWAKTHGYALPPSKGRRKATEPGKIAPGVSPAPTPGPGQSHALEASSSATVARPVIQAENAPQESREHSAPSATDNGDAVAQAPETRTDSQSERAQNPAPTSANMPPADFLQNPQEPAGAEGSFRYGPGRVGSGRAGSGPGPVQRTGPRRTRRGRRRKPPHQTDGSTT